MCWSRGNSRQRLQQIKRHWAKWQGDIFKGQMWGQCAWSWLPWQTKGRILHLPSCLWAFPEPLSGWSIHWSKKASTFLSQAPKFSWPNSNVLLTVRRRLHLVKLSQGQNNPLFSVGELSSLLAQYWASWSRIWTKTNMFSTPGSHGLSASLFGGVKSMFSEVLTAFR